MSRLVVRVNGVSRGELGGTLIGVDVRDMDTGEVLDRRSDVLDEINSSDEQARYAAMIEAIDMVQTRDAEQVMFVTDSAQFRQQLMGSQPPSETCEALHHVTLRALDWALAERWRVNWVPVGTK